MTGNPPGRSYLPPENTDNPPSPLALYSLYAGIAAWSVFPFFGGLIAVLLGNKARLEIAKSEGKLIGDGLAVIGLVLGYSNLLVCACGILCVAGLFLFPAAEYLIRR